MMSHMSASVEPSTSSVQEAWRVEFPVAWSEMRALRGVLRTYYYRLTAEAQRCDESTEGVARVRAILGECRNVETWVLTLETQIEYLRENEASTPDPIVRFPLTPAHARTLRHALQVYEGPMDVEGLLTRTEELALSFAVAEAETA